MDNISKHTPGPWAVNPINAQVDAFKDGEPIPVCRLLWPTTERSEAETEANAALIASAPDLLAERDRLREVNASLLAFAESFIAWHDQIARLRPDPKSRLPGMEAREREAHTAIAKAKGGAG